MTAPLRTYDPAQVSLVFKGNLITGIQDGTFVEVARDEDSWFLHGGGDGEQTRARNNNRAGTIKFTTTQSSPSNAVLSAIANGDESAGSGVGAAMVKDQNGTTLCECAEAFILKPADVKFAKEPSESREWVLKCPDLRMTVGSAE